MYTMYITTRSSSPPWQEAAADRLTAETGHFSIIVISELFGYPGHDFDDPGVQGDTQWTP